MKPMVDADQIELQLITPHDRQECKKWLALFGLQHYMPASMDSGMSLLGTVYITYLYALSEIEESKKIQRLVYSENKNAIFGARDLFAIVRQMTSSARVSTEAVAGNAATSQGEWNKFINYHRFVLLYMNCAMTCLLLNKTQTGQWSFSRISPDEIELPTLKPTSTSIRDTATEESIAKSNSKFRLSEQEQRRNRERAQQEANAREELLRKEEQRLNQTTQEDELEMETQILNDSIQTSFNASEMGTMVAAVEVCAAMMSWYEAHLQLLTRLTWQPITGSLSNGKLQEMGQRVERFLLERLSFGTPDELFNFTVTAIYKAALAATSKQSFFRHHGVIQEEVSIITVFNDSFHPEEARRIQRSFNGRTVDELFADQSHPFRSTIIMSVFAFYFQVHTRNQCTWEKEYFSSQYDRPDWLQKPDARPMLMQWHGTWLLMENNAVYTTGTTFGALAMWCFLLRSKCASTTHHAAHYCEHLLSQLIGPE
jgi:hypothetical protein